MRRAAPGRRDRRDHAARLSRRSRCLLLDHTIRELIVNLSETEVLDWNGLGLLVHLKMLAGDNAIGLIVRSVPPRVRSLLELSGLDRVLDIRAVEPTACTR